MTDPFSFTVTHRCSQTRGRRGLLHTPHGTIETPAFIFCATKAAIKGGVSIRQVKEAGTSIILSNTYHLMLQPGADLVAQHGGLHKFMGWDGPMLTDSGGFQVFSLGHGSVSSEIKGTRQHQRPKSLLSITEEGATFRSYRNGDTYLLTPERSIEIQRKLGADLVVVLDECTPFHVEQSYTRQSMERSHRWALRSLEAFGKDLSPGSQAISSRQALYGIVQGGIYPDLRRISATFVNGQPFFGQAIGGSLGAEKSQMDDVVGVTMAHLNPQRPTHLLGIGGISDIFSGVAQGIDTFDCVHPTRLARHGGALVQPAVWSTLPGLRPREHINLRNSCFQDDPRPIDVDCPCETCRILSRGYLHHLFKVQELLGVAAVTLHNMCTMNRLMVAIREAVSFGAFETLRKVWVWHNK